MADEIAVLLAGDVHGYLRLLFAQARAVEQVLLGRPLDLIVQVGDLGAYPEPERADTATRRHAREHPEELGFARYFAQRSPEADAIFGSGLVPPLIFVAGNHEDFGFLAAEARRWSGEPVPVDAYGGIRFLPWGATWTFAANGCSLRIGGLGGIEPPEGRRLAQRDSELPRKYLRKSDVERLTAGPLDLLVTHEAPKDFPFEHSGSPLVDDVLRRQAPQLHVFGHYHRPYGPREQVPGVQSRGLAINVPRALGQTPPEGSLALLRWRSTSDWSMEPVEPWLLPVEPC